MRVLQMLGTLNIGGLERVVVHLLNGLKSHEIESRYLALEAAGPLEDEILDKCIRGTTFNKKPGKSYYIPFRIAAIVKKWKIDVIHAHNFAPAMYSYLATRLPGCNSKLIYTEHNLVYHLNPKQKRRLARCLRAYDRVVCVSDELRYAVNEATGLPVDGSTVVHNGVPDISRAPNCPSPGQLRGILNRQADEVLVGTAVRMTQQKGVDVLVESFRTVAARNSKAHLVLMGDGPLFGEIRSLVDAFGLRDRVSMLGYRQDAPLLVRDLDVYVLPSRWEGLPMGIIEAMAWSLPVVATSVGGNPEAVAEDTGLLVPPDNPGELATALSHLCNDPALRTSFGKNARARYLSHFTVERMVCDYANIYREMTAQ